MTIEEIREKNRLRLVICAFRGQFFRAPNDEELAHWAQFLALGSPLETMHQAMKVSLIEKYHGSNIDAVESMPSVVVQSDLPTIVVVLPAVQPTQPEMLGRQASRWFSLLR